MIDEKALVPVLDEVLAFADQAITENSSYQSKINELNQKVAQSERLILEKVAEAKSSVFPPAAVEKTVDHLALMRLIEPQERVKIASQLRQDPASALVLLTKISESLFSNNEGGGIPKLTSTESSSDPDGWDDFARGREVRIR